MKSPYLFTVLMFFTLIISGCSQIDDKRYLVSIYQLDNARQQSLAHYQATAVLLTDKHGADLKAPIIIEKNLPNAGQPQFTQDYLGNVIFIVEFNNAKNLDAFLGDNQVRMSMDWLANLASKEVVFIAKDFNPMGMMADTASLNAFKARKAPAFLMINDITMKSFLNPLTPYRIMGYMDGNFPRLQQAQVSFVRPLQKVSNVRGDYKFDVMGISEWPSEQVFNQFHDDPDFIKLAKATRNKAFAAFTESKGSLINIDTEGGASN